MTVALPRLGGFGLTPAFNRMWAASIASNVSDGLAWTALPLLAITLTHSPILISILSGTVMLPWLFFAIPIGAIIDRVDRRIAISTANVIRFVNLASISLLVQSKQISIYLLILSAFIIGTCEVVVDTTAQTTIPRILEVDQLERGNSRLQISESVLQTFLGGPLGGLLFAVAYALPLLIASAGYACAALFLILIPVSLRPLWRAEERAIEHQDNSLVDDVKIGLRYLFGHVILRRIVLFSASTALVFSAANSTVILFLVKELHMKSSAFGFIMAIGGVGGLIGALMAPRLSAKFGRNTAMAAGITFAAFATFINGFLNNLALFIVIGGLESFAITQWNVLLMSTYQELIPSHLYGRIHGARRSIIWGIMPIGSLIGGFLATINLRAPWLIGGALATLICLANFKFLRTIRESIARADEAA